MSPAQVWYRSHCWRRILSAELSQRIGRSWLVHALGTGFFVSDGAFVITARHVITQGQAQLDQVAADRKRIVVGLAIQNSENMRGNFRQVGFDVVGEDEANDLTLIRLQQNPFAGEVSSGIQIGGEMVALPVGVGRLVTLLLSPGYSADNQRVTGVSPRTEPWPRGMAILTSFSRGSPRRTASSRGARSAGW